MGGAGGEGGKRYRVIFWGDFGGFLRKWDWSGLCPFCLEEHKRATTNVPKMVWSFSFYFRRKKNPLFLREVLGKSSEKMGKGGESVKKCEKVPK